jgi:hypothetical protein
VSAIRKNKTQDAAAMEKREVRRVDGWFRWWELVSIAGIALVFAVYLTWPLSVQMRTYAADPADALDGLFSAYAQTCFIRPRQAWVTHAVTSNPSSLFEHPGSFVNNPLLASKAVILTSFLLCAVSMYLLVRYLTGSPWAAAIAGFVYAFAPARMHQLGHVQLLSMQWMPLIVLCLSCFLHEKLGGSLIGLSISVLMQILCSLYLGYVGITIGFAFFLGIVLRRPQLLTRTAL